MKTVTSKLFTWSMDWILDWILPRCCLGCGDEGDFLCEVCLDARIIRKKFQVCPGCRKLNVAGRVCDKCRDDWFIDGLLVCCLNNKFLRDLVHEYKYDDMYGLSGIMSSVGVDMVLREKLRFDGVVYVPLYKSKKYWRGYNQSELMAKGIADGLGVVKINGLERTRYTKSQVGLEKLERILNVKNSFVGCKKGKINNQKVLLVDDVLTTGATLNECASELKKEGADEVWGLVLARGI
ncbi:hypothetical protein KJ855_02250 [Patescibacteria group bacterium]|nr:hypothetical protein [Patescibacteria group bacterium]